MHNIRYGIWWAIGIMVMACGGYFIGGGLMTVYRVRSEEARLQRAMEQATLPGFQLVTRSTGMSTRDIWSEWLIGHVPILDQVAWLSIEQRRSWSASYHTDAPPTEVYTQYLARLHPVKAGGSATSSYSLSTDEFGVHLSVTITAESLHYSRKQPANPYPAYPAPLQGTATDGAPTPETGRDLVPPQGTRVDISVATIELLSDAAPAAPEPHRAYPTP